MENQILSDFEVRVTFDEVKEKLRLEDEDDIEMMRGKFEEAKSIVCAKVLYRVSNVDKIDGDSVVIDNVEFNSHTLARNLNDIHRVFAYVATCGCEIDEWSHLEEDYVVNLWLDILKEMFLLDARKQFYDYIKQKFGIEKIASMNPGSGNADVWPIAQQQPLFSLLGNVEESIGVKLTPGFLMTPTKSVSGVLFPSDSEHVNCALCTRENCPNRKAPTDHELINSMHM